MSDPVRCSAAQFDVIAELIGAHKATTARRPKAAEAARMVLVDGQQARDVHLSLGISPQALANALRRYRAAHKLILSAYGL